MPVIGPGGQDLSPVQAQLRDNGLDPHWHHGAFIEIFVRAYQDSDGDGIGDLKGLISRLDYLQDLGVRGIWLMPITRSADSDHGYATTDFRSVEPEYGTLEDVRTLLREAHRRGIGVIMDYVINHGSHEHPIFQEALKGPSNPWRDWFVWSEDAPKGWDIWGKNPWYHAEAKPWTWPGEYKDIPLPPPGAKHHYFGTFGPHMPDFNLRKPAVARYHEDSLRFWLNLGLDGFRLDAVPHIIERDAVNWNDQPESRAYTKRLQDITKAYPKRYTVCEATVQPQAYGTPEVCGAAFAFGYVEHFVKAARGESASVQALAAYFRTAPAGMATFVSNHDIFAGDRLWNQVRGNTAQYKLAAAGYLLQPGTPYLYYGEEIGMASLPRTAQLNGDLPIRGSMSWTASLPAAGFSPKAPWRGVAPNAATHHVAAQQADPDSLLNFYKAMLKLRNTHPSIARGAFEHSFADGLVLGYQRTLADGSARERTLVLTNYGSEPRLVDIPGLPAGATLQTLGATEAGMRGLHTEASPLRAGEDGRLRVRVAPESVQVWRVEPPSAR
jgi:alpha-amylase